MPDPQTTSPTAEAVAAAHAVIAAQVAAEAARRAALVPLLASIANLPGFATIRARAAEVRDQVGTGELVYASLNAMVIGMEGVEQAARPAPGSAA